MATTDRGLQAVPRGLDRNLTTYLQALRTEMLRLSGMVRGSESSRAVRASEAIPFHVGSGNTSSSSVDVGAIASQILRDGAVSERKLADRAVSNRKLTDNAVDSRVLAPGGVGNTALAEGCVSSGKLESGAVTRGKIAQDAVDTNALSEQCVTAGKLANSAVSTGALADGAVTADKIASGVIPVVPEPPVPLRWVSGTANNGETVTIPMCWDAQPQVFLSAFSFVFPKTEVPKPPLPEIVVAKVDTVPEPQRLVIGSEQFTEVLDEDGVATGTWTFVAQGDFSWIAVGQEKVVS